MTSCASVQQQKVQFSPKHVWDLFQQKYWGKDTSFKFSAQAKIGIGIIKRRFNLYAYGNAVGNTRIDVVNHGVTLLQVFETPTQSFFYVAPEKKMYITPANQYDDVAASFGLHIPSSFETLCQFLIGNIATLYTTYMSAAAQSEGMLFTLNDGATMLIAYDGTFLQWVKDDISLTAEQQTKEVLYSYILRSTKKPYTLTIDVRKVEQPFQVSTGTFTLPNVKGIQYFSITRKR